MDEKSFSTITPPIRELAAKCRECNRIENSLYEKHQVKRGLRYLTAKVSLQDLQR